MSTPLVVNGTTYQYPQQGDKNWGPVLTNWSQAVTLGMLQKAGGSFTLTAEVDFGASFGLKALYLKGEASNIASTGFLRLENANAGIVWRNAANNADLALTVNASNQLTFNGVNVGATTSLTNGHILVGNVSNQPADVAMSGDVAITNAGVTTIQASAITDSKVAAGAAIALSKLATLTVSSLVVSSAGGLLTTQASPTLTELGYVGGVTSAIQTQLGTKLTKSGDTMSGVLNMGSNKIQALTQGSGAGEAICYPVGTAQLAANAVSQVVAGSAGSQAALSNSIGSSDISITTAGGKVLVFASVPFTLVGGTQTTFAVTRSGTAFAGNYVILKTATASSLMATVVAIDTPTAGTYTYHMSYDNGTQSGTAYSFFVVELKA